MKVSRVRKSGKKAISSIKKTPKLAIDKKSQFNQWIYKSGVIILTISVLTLVSIETKIVLSLLPLIDLLRFPVLSCQSTQSASLYSRKSFDQMVVLEKNKLEDSYPQRNLEIEDFTAVASSILAYDLDKEKTLFEKKPDTQFPIASLTKLMTGLLIRENIALMDEWLEFSKSDLEVDGHKNLFKTGEKFKVDDLLAASLIASNNEATTLLARSLENKIIDADQAMNFVDLMNQKAQAIGLGDTHYSNPVGFDSNNFSTSWDLVNLIKFILKAYPDFFLQTIELQKTITSQEGRGLTLTNTNYLLGEIMGIEGSKTGHTDLARDCLLLIRNFSGDRLVLIILGADNRREEMRDLINWIEQAYVFN